MKRGLVGTLTVGTFLLSMAGCGGKEYGNVPRSGMTTKVIEPLTSAYVTVEINDAEDQEYLQITYERGSHMVVSSVYEGNNQDLEHFRENPKDLLNLLELFSYKYF